MSHYNRNYGNIEEGSSGGGGGGSGNNNNINVSSSNRVFVYNISCHANREELREEFEIYGKVKSFRIKAKRSEKAGTTYGFVEFESNKSADRAVQFMNNALFGGMSLVVQLAPPPPPSSERSTNETSVSSSFAQGLSEASHAQPGSNGTNNKEKTLSDDSNASNNLLALPQTRVLNLEKQSVGSHQQLPQFYAQQYKFSGSARPPSPKKKRRSKKSSPSSSSSSSSSSSQSSSSSLSSSSSSSSPSRSRSSTGSASSYSSSSSSSSSRSSSPSSPRLRSYYKRK